MLDFGYYNMDCMQGMKEFPDNYFDLAIVDPPYGDGGGTWSGPERFGQRFDRYRAPAFTGNSTPSPTGGIPNERGVARKMKYEQISMLPALMEGEDAEDIKRQVKLIEEYDKKKRKWENAFQKWSNEQWEVCVKALLSISRA